MTESIPAAAALKGLVKEPLFYVIGIFALAGAYIVKDTPISPTWFVGVGLLVFAAILLVVQMIVALLDGGFKHRYSEALDAQSNVIEVQKGVIRELSQNSIAAHDSMSNGSDVLSNGYVRRSSPGNSGTSTSSSE